MQEFILFFKLWFFESGIKIILILFGAWIIIRIAKVFISRVVRSLVEKSEKIIRNGKIQEERIETLIRVFYSTLRLVVWIIAVLTVLPEFNINIAPLLAGAGLAGLAIGMGAKNLIQDYLAGVFILLEDQYRVGEVVNISGTEGKIIDLNLRRTVIKDPQGTVHYVPNGQITKSSNLSRK